MILAVLLLTAGLAAVSEGPALVLMHPQTLMELEDGGLDVAHVAFSGAARAKNNAELAKDPLYVDLVATLGRDVDELYKNDSKYGVGMKFTHRGFDIGWLTSPDTRWELATVVNRVDRKVFHPGTCGEVRFIYRLAYTTKTKSGELFSSRLPATLNVVHFVDDDGAKCARAAVRSMDLTGTKRKAVEVNLQTVRWPSTVRADMGGHAEYVLRVFERGTVTTNGRTRDALVPGLLENTPDAARIASDPALKRELASWVRDNLARIDAGTAIVPDKFLAKRAVSVTPHGLARPQNRPWLRSLDASTLDAAALASTTHVRTPAELLRRLDGLTCMGCHQARSLAGFHALGMERDATRIVDALGAGMSPHFHEDMPRREAYARDLVAGRVPSEVRRHPERQTDRGGFGDACGLNDQDFGAWKCGAGFVCAKVDEDDVGQCMPSNAEGGLAGAVGGTCRPGGVDMKRDKIASLGETRCPSTAVCEDVHVGFPGGMCAGTCASDTSAVEPGATCGAIAVLTPFNECLARGGLFSTCALHARPASLRECGFDNPCRPDYLCARTPSGASACLPPYFVLQMRVDGHPLPKSKRTWRDLLP